MNITASLASPYQLAPAEDYVVLPFATSQIEPGDYRVFVRAKVKQTTNDVAQAFIKPTFDMTGAPVVGQVQLFTSLFPGGAFSYGGGQLQTVVVEQGTDCSVGQPDAEQVFLWSGSVTVTASGCLSLAAGGAEASDIAGGKLTTVTECEIELIPA